MKSCVKRCLQHISISICTKGGLGRSPSKHRTKQTKNDHAKYLCSKHRRLAWNERYEINSQFTHNRYWLAPSSWVANWGGGVEKLGSTWSLDFSKKRFDDLTKYSYKIMLEHRLWFKLPKKRQEDIQVDEFMLTTSRPTRLRMWIRTLNVDTCISWLIRTPSLDFSVVSMSTSTHVYSTKFNWLINTPNINWTRISRSTHFSLPLVQWSKIHWGGWESVCLYLLLVVFVWDCF